MQSRDLTAAITRKGQSEACWPSLDAVRIRSGSCEGAQGNAKAGVGNKL